MAKNYYTINEIIKNKTLEPLGIIETAHLRRLMTQKIIPTEVIKRPVGRPAYVIRDEVLYQFYKNAPTIIGTYIINKWKRNAKRKSQK